MQPATSLIATEYIMFVHHKNYLAQDILLIAMSSPLIVHL